MDLTKKQTPWIEISHVEKEEPFLRRHGKFSISRQLLITEPEVIMQIMSQIIVVRAECMFFDVLEYEAISPLFDEVPEGEISPTYTVVFHETRHGKKRTLKWCFERQLQSPRERMKEKMIRKQETSEW